MKKVYVILSFTGTILSRIVKVYTMKEYSHTSISLDEKLEKMYSFGRLNPYNPFWGGFVHEGINTGTFKRFKYTKAIIYSIVVTDKQYEKMEKEIKYIESKKNEFRFNFIGIMLVMINKRIHRKRAFYCAEFVKHILQKGDIRIVFA